MWIYKEQEFTEIPKGYIGFIYMITNLISNRKYIGRKLFYTTKTRQVKGEKKKEKIESDWREYNSSSDELKKDIKDLGLENFRKEILFICPSKGTLNFIETRTIYTYGALESNDFYNFWVSCTCHKSHLRLLKDVI